MTTRATVDERFDGDRLDPARWLPHYLPHWSSRADSAATYELAAEGLRLSIAPEQGRWCADRHQPPLRVSCLQSGSFSGPVGSEVGQQPFAPGLTVTEEQPEFWGWTPLYGLIEITMRGRIGPGSMFAFWLSGVEDRPERSGEICVAEIFGDAVQDDTAAVGMGLHPFRDPRLTEQFAAEPLRLDPSDDHVYGVDWRPGRLDFLVDGQHVRRVDQAPDYPVQLMIGLFDFPGRDPERVGPEVPELVVRRVRSVPSPSVIS